MEKREVDELLERRDRADGCYGRLCHLQSGTKDPERRARLQKRRLRVRRIAGRLGWEVQKATTTPPAWGVRIFGDR